MLIKLKAFNAEVFLAVNCGMWHLAFCGSCDGI